MLDSASEQALSQVESQTKLQAKTVAEEGQQSLDHIMKLAESMIQRAYVLYQTTYKSISDLGKRSIEDYADVVDDLVNRLKKLILQLVEEARAKVDQAMAYIEKTCQKALEELQDALEDWMDRIRDEWKFALRMIENVYHDEWKFTVNVYELAIDAIEKQYFSLANRLESEARFSAHAPDLGLASYRQPIQRYHGPDGPQVITVEIVFVCVIPCVDNSLCDPGTEATDDTVPTIRGCVPEIPEEEKAEVPDASGEPAQTLQSNNSFSCCCSCCEDNSTQSSVQKLIPSVAWNYIPVQQGNADAIQNGGALTPGPGLPPQHSGLTPTVASNGSAGEWAPQSFDIQVDYEQVGLAGQQQLPA